MIKHANDKDSVICKSDKGIGSVVMNRSDCNDKMKEILNDQTKFKIVNNEDMHKINLNMNDIIDYQVRKLRKTKQEHNRI